MVTVYIESYMGDWTFCSQLVSFPGTKHKFWTSCSLFSVHFIFIPCLPSICKWSCVWYRHHVMLATNSRYSLGLQDATQNRAHWLITKFLTSSAKYKGQYKKVFIHA